MTLRPCPQPWVFSLTPRASIPPSSHSKAKLAPRQPFSLSPPQPFKSASSEPAPTACVLWSKPAFGVWSTCDLMLLPLESSEYSCCKSSPGGSDGKESASNAEDPGLIPRSGRSLEKGMAPLQCSCLEDPMDRGAWWAAAHWVTASQTQLTVRCCCCCCEVASVVSDSVRPHSRQPARLPRPWDPPGKNTAVGCHSLLQCIHAGCRLLIVY